jgi:hypothetical protein
MSLEAITQELKNIQTTILPIVEKQGEEIKTHGETSRSTAKTLGTLEQKYDALLADLEAEKKAAREFEAKMQRGGFGGVAERKTPGQLFVESKEFNNYADTGNRAKVQVKALSTSVISNPNLTRPDRQDGIIVPAQRLPTIRDLLPSGTTTSNAIEQVQETLFFQVAAEVVSGGAAAATTIVLTTVQGMFVGQVLTFGAGSGTSEQRTISAINTSTRTVTVSVAFTNTHLAAELVGSVQMTGIAEEDTKPEGAWRTSLLSVPVRTIPYFIRVSKQTLDDVAQLQSLIDVRLSTGLAIAEDFQLLNGTGTGQQLTGLMTSARAYNRSTSGTKLDRLRRAYTQVRLSEYTASGVVMNPTDWEDIELLKGTDSRYLWVTVNDGGTPRLWRMAVVETTAITANNFLVGAFSQGAMLFDRQTATVEVFEQDGTNVRENMITIRAEERLALFTYRPDAFVQGALS